jgi:hypothetical protein
MGPNIGVGAPKLCQGPKIKKASLRTDALNECPQRLSDSDIALGTFGYHKRTSVQFGSGRGEHIVRRHRPADALERKLADRFNGHGFINSK